MKEQPANSAQLPERRFLLGSNRFGPSRAGSMKNSEVALAGSFPEGVTQPGTSSLPKV